MHDCVKMIASNLFSGPLYSHNSLGMNNLIFDDFSFRKSDLVLHPAEMRMILNSRDDPETFLN